MAPGFHELEHNVKYYPRKDEFDDAPISDEEETKRLQQLEDEVEHEGLEKLDARQQELAQVDIDIDTLTENCFTNLSESQKLYSKRPELTNLNHLFS